VYRPQANDAMDGAHQMFGEQLDAHIDLYRLPNLDKFRQPYGIERDTSNQRPLVSGASRSGVGVGPTSDSGCTPSGQNAVRNTPVQVHPPLSEYGRSRSGTSSVLVVGGPDMEMAANMATVSKYRRRGSKGALGDAGVNAAVTSPRRAALPSTLAPLSNIDGRATVRLPCGRDFLRPCPPAAAFVTVGNAQTWILPAVWTPPLVSCRRSSTNIAYHAGERVRNRRAELSAGIEKSQTMIILIH
jgi:hypothetical protein